MNCSSCGADLVGDGRFCARCGAPRQSLPRETRKIVTILFCDLTGSTAMSERVDAEALREILLRYFDLMRVCLLRHGGSVEKYIGDAVMAVFGVPVVHEDDALRAIRAAQDMRVALDELNEGLSRQVGLRLAIRIGINTGEVMATDGATGGQALVAGEPVNVAARLEQHAPPGEVLLGETTYLLARDGVDAEPVAPLVVKGKTDPVPAWRLRAVVPAGQVNRRWYDTPLLGRRDEADRLEQLLTSVVKERRAQLCTIFGDPGMGKTRLALEFARAAESRGVRVAVGSCLAYDTRPLAPFDAVLGKLIGPSDGPRSDQGMPLAVTGRALRAVLADGAIAADPQESYLAVREAVGELAAAGPVVIVLDDLQWASQVLLDLVAYLTDRLHHVGVLLLCLARFELLDLRPHWGGGHLGATSLVLRRLSPHDSIRLAAHVAEVSTHLSGGVIEQIAGLAEGNPFFIEQLVAVRQEDAAVGDIPATLRAVIGARLELLPQRLLDWIRLAAVVGRTFTEAEVLDLPGAERLTDAEMQHLVRRRLIEPGGYRDQHGTYQFTNSQIRDVAYAALPKKVRARWHAHLADRAIADGDDEQAGGHLEQAVRYFAELGLTTTDLPALAGRAATCLHRAANDAQSHGDVRRARNLLDRALALPSPVGAERLRTMSDLADALVATGDIAQADQVLEELLAAAEDAGERQIAGYALVQQAMVHLADRGLDSLVGAAEAALPLAEAADDGLGQARCWLRLGQARQSAGRFGEAAGHFDRALGHARAVGARLELATSLGGLAYCLWRGPQDAPTAIERCQQLQLAGDAHSRLAWVAVSCPYAMLLAMRGGFAEARTILADATRILDELGHVTAAATVPLFAGTLEAVAGEPAAAERALRTALTTFRQMGDPYLTDYSTVSLARAVFDQGRPAEAETLLQSCRHLGEDSLRAESALAGSLRARILADCGESGPAWAASSEALAGVRELDATECRATVLLDAAHVCAASGRAEEAIGLTEQAWDCFSEKGHHMGQERTRALSSRIRR